MKKFGGYIILLFTLVNIFTPVSFYNSQINIKKVAAEENSGSVLVTTSDISQNSVNIKVVTKWDSSKVDATGYTNTVLLTIKDEKGSIKTAEFQSNLLIAQYPTETTVLGKFGELTKNTTYKISAVSSLNDPKKHAAILTSEISFKTLAGEDSSSQEWYYDGRFGITGPYNTKDLCTTTSGQAGFNAPCFTGDSQQFKDLTAKYEQAKKDGKFIVNESDKDKILGNDNPTEIMPACSIIPPFDNETGNPMGCIAQGFYYVIFVPSSFIFALAGKFFDFTFKYSISDTSYRGIFVTEGWKIVRDLCNIFFIFVLLKTAIQMILNIGHGAKEAIVKVIVIGLIINFSLFTTQIIIDSSNILARLFYNSEAIKVMMEKDGDSLNRAGIDLIYADSVSNTGEIPISAAIVSKVNPQSIIIRASQIRISDPAQLKDSQNSDTFSSGTKNKGIGAGSFILITILASAINIIGFFVFISIGIMFVARVIGLWFAMILAPLAFFSYTMPHTLDDMDYIGWTKWWPETLKLAFMAPVFMFFMYLILIFIDNSFLDLKDAAGQTGTNFVLSILLPFVFIIILLNYAKSVAKTMSGKVGGMVTNYATAAGGAILGGAALGTAVLGRQTLGAVSKYALNDSARDKAINFASTKSAWKEIKGLNALNPFAYGKVATTFVKGIGQATAAGVGAGVSRIGQERDPVTGQLKAGTGWFKSQTNKLKDKEHGEHVLNEYANKLRHGSKYSDLDETDQEKVRESINKDIMAKTFSKTNRTYDQLNATQKANVDAQKVGHATWTDALNAENATRHGLAALGVAGQDHIHTAETMATDSKAPIAMSEFVNALRKGSYDIRNLSKMETKSKGMPAFFVNSTAGIASMFRSNLKSEVGINHGVGNKDFMKDLKEVLSEAFKTAKLKVEIPSGGGHGGGHDDHGGGHDDHGHGGGGHH